MFWPEALLWPLATALLGAVAFFCFFGLNAVGVLKSAAILFIRPDTFVDRFMAENGAYIYVKSQINKNAHRNITFEGIPKTFL